MLNHLLTGDSEDEANEPQETTAKPKTNDSVPPKQNDRSAWLAAMQADLAKENSEAEEAEDTAIRLKQVGNDPEDSPKYGYAVTFLQTYSGASGYDVHELKAAVKHSVAEVVGTTQSKIIVEPGVDNEKWRQAGHVAMMIQVLSNNSKEADMILATIPLPIFSKTLTEQLHKLKFTSIALENTVKPRLVNLKVETTKKSDQDPSVMLGDEYDSEMDLTLDTEQSDALESGDNISELINEKVANQLTPRVSSPRGGSRIYVPKENHSFIVEGSNETVSYMIDGLYVQQPETTNKGRPTFVRLSAEPQLDPMVMWYYPKRRCWMLGPRSIVGTDDARALVKCDVDHPMLISRSKPAPTWFDWHMKFQGFQPNQNFNFRRAMVREAKAHRAETIRVAGRVGYNRAMNGIYVRGKRIHCGKHYYKHQEQDFKIRWFQNEDKPGGKWVIDWRMGLLNDNVGAAVIKEDTPEPWMCATGWRVYDARIQQANKWVIDETVKISIVNTRERQLFD